MKNLNIYKKEKSEKLMTRTYILGRLVMAMLALFLCLNNHALAQVGEPVCTYSEAPIPNTTYYINGQPTTINSRIIVGVTQGTRVKVCFTAPAGPSTYTLVSYKAPSNSFSEANAHLQELYDYQTVNTTGAQEYCLEIDVPNCYFQIDFVKGCKIDQLGPAGSNNFYGRQGRLISYAEGGSGKCVDLQGCTLGYWKNHTDRWCTTYTTEMQFSSVFTSAPESFNDLTLLQALNLGGGGANNLARQGVAALLNSCSNEIPSPYTAGTVVYIVNTAFENEQTIGAVAEELDELNNAGCSLGGTRATTSLRNSKTIEAAEQTANHELRAYPVPFSATTTIEFTVSVNENYTVNLYNLNGSVVKELKTGTARAGEVNQVELDGTDLPEGIYIARMMSDSSVKTLKLVLKKQ